MTEYLISFNDEWVQPHTAEQLREKAVASLALVEEMKAAGVWVYGNGALDESTIVCAVEAKDGEPVFTDGPFVESTEHLGGFSVIDVANDDEARYWAGRLAVCLEWPQEVQRFPPGPPAAADADAAPTGQAGFDGDRA